MTTIERPGPGDVGEIISLWIELAEGQREFGSHLYARENRDVIESQISQSLVTGELLVARNGGDGGVGGEGTGDGIVGFVMYGPESGSYQQDTTRGTIHNIYVREPYRGEGIGTDLLDAAEEALANAGVEVVSIGVMAANEDAQRLYRRRGYGPHRVELEKETETTNQSSENE